VWIPKDQNDAACQYLPLVVKVIGCVIRDYPPGIVDQDDLLQLGWIVVNRCLQKFDPNRGTPLLNYLGKALTHEFRTELRRGRLIGSGDQVDVSVESDDWEQRADVLDCVGRLPRKERQVIEMRFWSGLEWREVGKRLRLRSPHYVGQLACRHLKKMLSA